MLISDLKNIALGFSGVKRDSVLDDITNAADQVTGGDANGDGKKGHNWLGDIGGFYSNAFKQIAGFYGFQDGKYDIKKNFFVHQADEGLGEITGRNQSRAALHQAEDQFNYSKQQAEMLLAQQRFEKENADRLQSSEAGAVRAASSQGGANYGNTTPLGFGGGYNNNQPQKDFLGL